MILAGDVGGTKTLLALYQVQAEGLVCIKKQHYLNHAYTSFTALLQHFLPQAEDIRAACIGVAGPIEQGDCKTTNLPWYLSSAALKQQLQCQRLTLLNDLAATAWGILSLPADNFVPLNPKANSQPGHVAILAAGTGLGMSVCCWDGTRYHVMPTEGGHVDFAPNDATDIALLEFLLPQYGHVSYERIVSGMGLSNIYQFLKQRGFAKEQAEIAQQMAQNDPGAVIGAAALAGTDALCVATLDLFCKLYGAVAGNVALSCLPYGGVFLAGGIVTKILPFMLHSRFMHSFIAKGRYQDALAQFPVNVCTNPEVALLGAAQYALQHS